MGDEKRKFEVGDRVYPRSGGEVVTVAEVARMVNSGSFGGQEFRTVGDFRWHASSDYRVAEPLPPQVSERPVAKTTRLSVNGSTSLVVTPPLPCGLVMCVGELHITGKHGDTQRVHLSARQRSELIAGLGGTL
jgi:hypothetical protein